MAIKSKELAGMLGVSAATMSLVLNHKPGISEELRNSLLERIREMGYGYMIREEEERERRKSLFQIKRSPMWFYRNIMTMWRKRPFSQR